MMALVCDFKIGALTKLAFFFPVLCFIHVLDRTLAEQLYRALQRSILYMFISHFRLNIKAFTVGIYFTVC